MIRIDTEASEESLYEDIKFFLNNLKVEDIS